MGTTSVRRNLFQNHLSRRPVSTPGPNTGPLGLPSQVLLSNAPESNSSNSVGPIDDGEIVVKDKNGSFTLDIPVLPPIVGEDDDEMEGIETEGTGGDSTAATGADPTGQGAMNGREKGSMSTSCLWFTGRTG
ncbi:hypothetical protein BDV10DRAFT_165639 [Aspergillus recurvatus]